MARRFSVGERVQTGFGKGTVLELRNHGRVLVEVRDRQMVVADRDIGVLDAAQRRHDAIRRADQPPRDVPSDPPISTAAREVDLHGLTVEEAIVCAQQALNAALVEDLAELRFIHGRSGGRIRSALHRWLREVPSVRRFVLDPRNAGVTIVAL